MVSTEIVLLKKLNKIEISCNNIEIIPTEIGMVIDLKTLEIFKNKISVMPNEIVNLSNLTSLCIDHDVKFPPELSKIKYFHRWKIP